MKILVTNDDGVNAPGLWALAAALQDLGEVVVSAPDRDQSGIGTSMTLLDVVKAREVAEPPVAGIRTYAVEGTPADCVILATEILSPGRFDAVVSGINDGSNLGLDFLTSGTVGAAFQGYFRGIHSVAMSVASLTNVRYGAAARSARAIVGALSKGDYGQALFLNVNLPNTAPDAIKGVAIAKVGPRLYLENVERGNNGRRTHYWIKHNRLSNYAVADGSDIWALRNGRVAITPLNGLLESGWDAPDLRGIRDAVSQELAAMGNHAAASGGQANGLIAN